MARGWAKARSLVQYLLQVFVCFLVLGPLFSRFVFALLGQLVQGITRQTAPDALGWFGLWGIFFSAPLGFCISLIIDYRKAPLSSCWPLRYVCQNTWQGGLASKFGLVKPSVYLTNRVFFAQPGQVSRWFWGRKRSRLYWFLLSVGVGFLAISAGNMLLWLLRNLGLETVQKNNIAWIFAHYTNVQAFFLLVVSL